MYLDGLDESYQKIVRLLIENARVSYSENGRIPTKFSSDGLNAFFAPVPQRASKLTFKSTPNAFAL